MHGYFCYWSAEEKKQRSFTNEDQVDLGASTAE